MNRQSVAALFVRVNDTFAKMLTIDIGGQHSAIINDGTRELFGREIPSAGEIGTSQDSPIEASSRKICFAEYRIGRIGA
jgi:hypothetical protein